MGRSVPRLRAVIFDWGGTPWRAFDLDAQQVSVDVTPDGVVHELLDVLDIVDAWQSR